MCAGAANKKKREESLGLFLTDTVSSGRQNEVRKKVTILCNREAFASALQYNVREAKKVTCRKMRNLAHRFMDRKLADMGRNRVNTFKANGSTSEMIECQN